MTRPDRTIASLKKENTMKTIDEVAAALRRGESVTIREFGTFSVVETPARMGRNPGTGEAVEIKAGRKVKFKASPKLLG